MPGPNAPYTALDANQVLKQSFDEAADRLRVDAVVTATIGDVVIDAATSSIAIKDPINNNVLNVNADGSINADVVLTAAADSITAVAVAQSTLIDDVSDTINYFGFAPAGSAQSSSAWQIKKLVTTGTVTSVLFANGNTNYSNVWDNRTSLTYS